MHGLIRAAWPDAPWAAAAAVTVMAMLALVLLVQLGTTLYGRLCWRAGAYRKSDTEPPRLPTPAQFCESCLYLLGAVIVWSLFPASWYYGRPGFFATAYLFLAAFVIADAIFYGVHRWLHHNKTASRLIHGRHHHRIDNLGKGTFLDGLLTIGTGSTAVYLLTYAVVGNFNSFLLAVQGMAVHGMALHNSPDAMRFQHPAELSIVLLCPQMLLLLMLPIMQRGYQHLQHHTHSRCNYAGFLTILDNFFGTARNLGAPCSLLVLAVHLAYQAAALAGVYAACMWPARTLAVVLLHAALPSRVIAAAIQAAGVPQLLRWSCGWLQDVYRQDMGITCEPAGLPGSFQHAQQQQQHHQQREACGKADGCCTGSNTAGHSYLFMCHPTGVLSRGALLTFAASGWRSPVSSLGSVSFAVSKALMAAPVPLLREFLCAIGCVPDSRAVLQRCFKAGSSIAVTPGGWSEPIFTGGAYRLDISRLQRYLSLASAAGATLVPVLCLGEQLVSTDHLCNPEPCAWPTFARWVRLLLLATPPEPVHVVFGAPVTPQQGKSLQQLHRRYMQALSNLAKQYGVQYELVKGEAQHHPSGGMAANR